MLVVLVLVSFLFGGGVGVVVVGLVCVCQFAIIKYFCIHNNRDVSHKSVPLTPTPTTPTTPTPNKNDNTKNNNNTTASIQFIQDNYVPPSMHVNNSYPSFHRLVLVVFLSLLSFILFIEAAHISLHQSILSNQLRQADFNNNSSSSSNTTNSNSTLLDPVVLTVGGEIDQARAIFHCSPHKPLIWTNFRQGTFSLSLLTQHLWTFGVSASPNTNKSKTPNATNGCAF